MKTYHPIGYAWLENGKRKTWATVTGGADAAEALARFKKKYSETIVDAWILK